MLLSLVVMMVVVVVLGREESVTHRARASR
jgi:hypothetical protein